MATDPQVREALQRMSPQHVMALLRTKRNRLQKMPEGMRSRFLGSVFDRYVGPTLRQRGIKDEDLATARTQWAASMTRQGVKPLPSGFGAPPTEKPSALATIGASAAGELESINKTVADWLLKAERPGPVRDWLQKQRDISAKSEASIKELTKDRPTAQFAGEMIGMTPALGLYETGAGMIPGAAKTSPAIAKLLSMSGKGAAGFAAMEPALSSRPGDIPKAAAVGAVAGPVVEKIVAPTLRLLSQIPGWGLRRILGLGSKEVTKQVTEEVGPKTATRVVNELDALSKEKFGKEWDKLGEEERQKLISETAEKYKTAPKAKAKPAEAKTPEQRAKDAADSKWRQSQYQKLGKQGVKITEDVKTRVRTGKSAEEIMAAAKTATATPTPAPKFERASTDVAGLQKSRVAAAAAGDKEVYEETTKKLTELEEAKASPKEEEELAKTSPTAATVIANAENPQIQEALKGVQAVAEPTVTKVPEGVSGTPGAKALLDQWQDAKTRIADPNESPLVKARLKKRVENIEKVINKDPAAAEAMKRLNKADKVAAARAKTAAEAPVSLSTVAEESATEEHKAVGVAPETTSSFEMLDALKGIKVPGLNTESMYRGLETLRKGGQLKDESLAETIDAVYRQIGDRLGIEGAESMPLEDLYKRVTTIGR